MKVKRWKNWILAKKVLNHIAARRSLLIILHFKKKLFNRLDDSRLSNFYILIFLGQFDNLKIRIKAK